MYVCACVYVHICIHVYIVCIYIYMYIYVYMCIYIYVCVCVCVSVYRPRDWYIYIYICIFFCVCVCIYIYIFCFFFTVILPRFKLHLSVEKLKVRDHDAHLSSTAVLWNYSDSTNYAWLMPPGGASVMGDWGDLAPKFVSEILVRASPASWYGNVPLRLMHVKEAKSE